MAEKTSTPQLRHDTQGTNALATEFLTEAHQAMTGPADAFPTQRAKQNAWDDLNSLIWSVHPFTLHEGMSR
jgi:hypothetical protein